MGDSEATVLGSMDLKPHYKKVKSAATENRFADIEQALKDFWSAVSVAQRKQLGTEEIITTQIEVDSAFYEELIQILMPDILENIDVTHTKEIRAFAKNIDTWVAAAVDGFPPKFVEAKQAAALAFGQRLRRCTGLNHLVQAARAVLANPDHVAQMQEDYKKVDAIAAQEQLNAICPGCPLEKIAELEATFRRFHQATSTTLEMWANWLQGLVEQSMGEYVSDEQYSRIGSDLLLRWSLVSSLIIRDLTLRSAASFGPFHLMRLLCDEYVYYLVEAAQRKRMPRPFTIETDASFNGAAVEGASLSISFDVPTISPAETAEGQAEAELPGAGDNSKRVHSDNEDDVTSSAKRQKPV